MNYPPIKKIITKPSALAWNPINKIIRYPNGRFKHDFNVKDYEFTGTNYYVDVVNGNDSNTGLSTSQKLKSIVTAITKHGSLSPANVNTATISRSNEWAYSGTYSWKVVTPGSLVSEGLKANPNPTTVVSRSYTIRAKIKALAACTLEVSFAGAVTTYTFAAGEVKTLEKTANATATSHNTQVRTSGYAQAKTFYVDEFELIDNTTGNNIISTYQTYASPLVVNLYDGIYNKTNGLNDTSIGVDTVIKAVSGSPIISAENSQTWSLSSGQTNTYQSNEASTVYRVLDSKTPDVHGDYVEYAKQTSIANVESNPGSWYWASNILYVHCLDNRTPDTDIHGYIAVKGIDVTDKNVYLEGITIQGGGNSASTSKGPINHVSSGSTIYNLYMKNCTVKYSINDNKGIYISKSIAYLQNCLSARNNSDGFNYHTAAKALELECVGRDNGYTGNGNDNGSSMHEAGTIIRVNGEYTRNYGPNVIDINEGTQSWNIGCKSYNSLSALSTNNNDFMLEQGLMWLDNCKSNNSTYGVGCDATSPIGTMYIRMVKESSPRITGGNLIKY